MKYNSEYFENLPVIDPYHHFTTSGKNWEKLRQWIKKRYGLDEVDDAVIQVFIESEEQSVWQSYEVERWGEGGDMWVVREYLVVDVLEDDQDRVNKLVGVMAEEEDILSEYTRHLPYI